MTLSSEQKSPSQSKDDKVETITFAKKFGALYFDPPQTNLHHFAFDPHDLNSRTCTDSLGAMIKRRSDEHQMKQDRDCYARTRTNADSKHKLCALASRYLARDH